MEVEVSESDDRENRVCVRIKGVLDETNAIALADRLLNACPNPIPGRVHIDLSTCSSICNQGFAALVSFRLSTPIANQTVEVSGQNTETDKRMRILRLDRLFQIHPPRDEPHTS